MPSSARRFEKRPSLDNLVERVDAQRPGEITGDTIPTGFGSLDKLLGGGVRRRDLILLGGDIGSGKSALALGIALRVAQQSVGVAYLSGEMNEERLMERALAIEGKVAVDELRAAKLNDQTRAGVGAAAVRLRGLPLSLLLLAGEDFETVFDRLDPLRQIGLVIVDYRSSCRHRRRARRRMRTRRWCCGTSRHWPWRDRSRCSWWLSCRVSRRVATRSAPRSTTTASWARRSSTPTSSCRSSARRCTTRAAAWTARPS